MSGGFMVYSLAPAALAQAAGSGSAALKTALGLGTDEQSEALAGLIDGAQPTHEAPVVIYAFERLCAHLGRRLSAVSLSGARASFLEAVEAELAAKSFPVKIYSVVMGGGPLKLPWADDYPQVGHVNPDKLQAAAAHLQATPLESNDADIDAVFTDMTDWIEYAAPRAEMLVGFWS